MIEEVLDETVGVYVNEDAYPENWNLAGLTEAMKPQFGVEVSWKKDEIDALTPALLKDELSALVKAAYRKKEAQVGSDMMRYLERMLMLQVVDAQWKDHLLAMDHLKEGIGLRGYGQKDPLIEYKREGFEMFEAMEAQDRPGHRELSDEGPGGRGGGAGRPPPATCRRCRWRCRGAAAAGASSPPRPPEACRPWPLPPWRPPGPRPAGTIPARAAAGRNTRSAAGPEAVGD